MPLGARIFQQLERYSGMDISHRSNAKASARRCEAPTIRDSDGFLANGGAGKPTIPPDLAGPLMGVGTIGFEGVNLAASTR
jgi:hypothetical protein